MAWVGEIRVVSKFVVLPLILGVLFVVEFFVFAVMQRIEEDEIDL
jgi:hypothetical protein